MYPHLPPTLTAARASISPMGSCVIAAPPKSLRNRLMKAPVSDEQSGRGQNDDDKYDGCSLH